MDSVMDSVTNSTIKADTEMPIVFDLAQTPLREVNRFLHQEISQHNGKSIRILNPDGAHNIAVGVDHEVNIEIAGHTGYYAAGMNQLANVMILGNAGPGVAENMMSGCVQVKGFASVSAGASAQGGLLIIEGNAGLRCGISLKGGDIVVGGSVGSFSAFMAQAGRIVICGDAGDALGDSLYEAVIYVRGKIKSLGADAQIEPMTDADYQTVTELLAQANFPYSSKEFRRVASAKQLYHWNADDNQEY
ncbi:MAG: protein glxC [Cyanobacteria bacterium RM1_2_2]|nr:protein glxC [Cyanobacteria bacterium RM1_2_2]